MRICFLANAGSANTRTWVDYFADRLGHDVHVVSVNRFGELSPRVVVHQLGRHRDVMRAGNKLAYLTRIRKARSIVQDVGPDLVVAYRVASYGYMGARLGFHPLAVAAQSEHIVALGDTVFKRRCARAALGAADVINSWGPHMTRRLVELGARPDRILTCPRGVDLTLFSAPDAGAEREYAVITSRALERRYGLDVIIRALGIVGESVPGVSAAIVGDGSAAGELRDLAERLGMADRIRFPGAVPNDELPALLRRSAVYASAIRTDGVSASLLEAMACGCFPVVPGNPANRSWVEDGTGGYLVGDVTPEGFADALLRALNAVDLRSSAAGVNRRIVEERADLDRNMRTIEAAYLELVDAT